MSESAHDAPVSALILAAGSSSRLGEPKQSVVLNGQTLLLRATTLAAASVNAEVHVVIGANAALDRKDLAATPARTHAFADWEQGQNASLAFGLAQIPANHAVLVMLVDQYRLTVTHLRALIQAWRARPTAPAAARYRDTVGVPVVWPPDSVRKLRTKRCLGRDLLAQLPFTDVAMPVAGFDLDTPTDLAQLRGFEQAPRG